MTATRDALDIVPFRIAVATIITDGDGDGTLTDAGQDANDIYGDTRVVPWSWCAGRSGLDLPASTGSFTQIAAPVVVIPSGYTSGRLYVAATGTPLFASLRLSGTGSGGPYTATLAGGLASVAINVAAGTRTLAVSVQNLGVNDVTITRAWITLDTL